MYFSRTIDAVEKTISEPIVHSITRDVSKYLDIKGIEGIKLVQEDGLQKEDGDDRMANYTNIEVTHSFDEQDTDANNDLASYLLYGDFKLNANYIVKELKLEIKISGKSKTQINSVKGKLKHVMLHKGNTMTHDIAYRYYMDNRFLSLLRTMYDIRIENGCFAGTFQEYFNDLIVDNRTTLTSNQVGDKDKLNIMFKEEQHDLVGVFESNTMNKEVDYNEKSGEYSVHIEYSINISLPFEFLIRYESSIGTSILPLEYLYVKHKTPGDKVAWLSGQADAIVKKPQVLNSLSSLVINIPAVDTYHPKGIDYMIDIFTVLASKDVGTDVLFNLKELGDVELIPEMITYLETTEYPFMTKHGESVIHIYIYEDDVIQPDNMLTVDANLNVIYNGVMDKCKVYRTVFGIDKQYITQYKFNGSNPYPWFVPGVDYDPLLLHSDNTPKTGVAYTEIQTSLGDSTTGPYSSPGSNPNDPRDGSWVFSHMMAINLRYEHARSTTVTTQISAIIALTRIK